MNFAAKIQIRSIFTLANNSTRVSNLCGRKADNIYGVEEGHGFKNEVRKEKWIKRHRIHKNVRYFFLMLTKFIHECLISIFSWIFYIHFLIYKGALSVHFLLVFYLGWSKTI